MGFPPVIEWKQMDDREPFSRVLAHDEPVQHRAPKIVRYIRGFAQIEISRSEIERELMTHNFRTSFKGLVYHKRKSMGFDVYIVYFKEGEDPELLFCTAERATNRRERL
jgi:hypothetical protein